MQPQVIPEGTEVLLENTAQKQRKGGKLEPLWQGPYTISQDLGKGLYELLTVDGRVLKNKANINRLKMYTRRKKSPPTSPTRTSPDCKKRKVGIIIMHVTFSSSYA